VKTCVGSDYCRFGLGDSTSLGIAIENRFQGLETPAKLKFAVAGCPRNCSEALCKDFGVVAVGDGRWDIYVGGAAGAHIRRGDLLATVDSGDAVLTVAGRFIQYYRENAKWLERTYDFVPRLGLERLRALLIDDEENIVTGLDDRIATAIEGYRDPWLERAAPKSPAQFTPALPLLPLPQVPVR
jgi:nitrite reductase (NADH) large subunit